MCVADVPLKPDKTWVSEGADGILTVRWKAPYDGGSPILHYLLLARYVLTYVLVTASLQTINSVYLLSDRLSCIIFY